MIERRERQASGGFAARLRQVIDAWGSTNSIAKAIERSEGAVRKWLRGESEPNVTDLRTLCEHTHTSIEWLVTGHGRREAPPGGLQESPAPDYRNTSKTGLDHTLLEAVMDAVEREIHSGGEQLAVTKRPMLIATLYDLSLETRQVDPEAVARLIKLAR
jgi:transcriptional regulator with XRE-family HTH domain